MVMEFSLPKIHAVMVLVPRAAIVHPCGDPAGSDPTRRTLRWVRSGFGSLPAGFDSEKESQRADKSASYFFRWQLYGAREIRQGSPLRSDR